MSGGTRLFHYDRLNKPHMNRYRAWAMLISNAFPRPPIVKAISRTYSAFPRALLVVGSALWPLDPPLASFIPALTPQMEGLGKTLGGDCARHCHRARASPKLHVVLNEGCPLCSPQLRYRSRPVASTAPQQNVPKRLLGRLLPCFGPGDFS
jgi:hypothetical protein